MSQSPDPEDQPDRDLPEATLDDLADMLSNESDELLAGAVRRLQKEREEGVQAFFKHGQHGSHNSG
jgi:hypothetical protein